MYLWPPVIPIRVSLTTFRTNTCSSELMPHQSVYLWPHATPVHIPLTLFCPNLCTSDVILGEEMQVVLTVSRHAAQALQLFLIWVAPMVIVKHSPRSLWPVYVIAEQKLSASGSMFNRRVSWQTDIAPASIWIQVTLNHWCQWSSGALDCPWLPENGQDVRKQLFKHDHALMLSELWRPNGTMSAKDILRPLTYGTIWLLEDTLLCFV